MTFSAFHLRLRRYGFRTYAEYLGSARWRKRRRAFMKKGLQSGRLRTGKGGLLCEFCRLNRGPVEIHHATYARVCAERDTDLVLLCSLCHGMVRMYEMLRTVDVETATALVRQDRQPLFPRRLRGPR